MIYFLLAFIALIMAVVSMVPTANRFPLLNIAVSLVALDLVLIYGKGIL